MMVEPIVIEIDLYKQKNLWAQAHTVEQAKTLMDAGVDGHELVMIDIEGNVWPSPVKNGFFLEAIVAWGEYE
jgi:hypothetical protein